MQVSNENYQQTDPQTISSHLTNLSRKKVDFGNSVSFDIAGRLVSAFAVILLEPTKIQKLIYTFGVYPTNGVKGKQQSNSLPIKTVKLFVG